MIKTTNNMLYAPNGQPSKLTPELYYFVRTSEFKKWFGDWELPYQTVEVVPADIVHGFRNFKEATKWAIDNIARTYNDDETGHKGEIRISATSIRKYLSRSAVDKSYNIDTHLAVLKVLPSAIKSSYDAETHPDYYKINGERNKANGINPDSLIHRLYAAVKDNRGNLFRVKITLKEDCVSNNPHVPHSYEATKIELMAGYLGEVALSANTNSSITLSLLLKNVEKSYERGRKLLDYSRILDENGEPLVLYSVQKSMSVASSVNHKDGIYFTPDRNEAIAHGADLDGKPVFINARNPLEIDFDGDSELKESPYHSDIQSEYRVAQEEGFDILIASNTFDGENYLDQYVVHESSQVLRIDLLDVANILRNMDRNHFSEEKNEKKAEFSVNETLLQGKHSIIINNGHKKLESIVSESKLSPLLQQYADFKKAKPNVVPLFHVSGGYETYEDDAFRVGKVLGLPVRESLDHLGPDGHPAKYVSLGEDKLLDNLEVLRTRILPYAILEDMNKGKENNDTRNDERSNNEDRDLGRDEERDQSRGFHR